MHLHKVCVLDSQDPFTIICMQQRYQASHAVNIAVPPAPKFWFPLPVLSQDSSVREFLDGTFAVKSGQGSEEAIGHHTSRATGQNNRASDQAQNSFKTGGSNNAAGQKSTAFGQGGGPFKAGGSDNVTGQSGAAFGQGGSPFKAGGSTSATGQNSSASDQAGSPFKGAGSGSSGSTVTTGVPAFSPKQGAFQSSCCCPICCLLQQSVCCFLLWE